MTALICCQMAILDNFELIKDVYRNRTFFFQSDPLTFMRVRHSSRPAPIHSWRDARSLRDAYSMRQSCQAQQAMTFVMCALVRPSSPKPRDSLGGLVLHCASSGEILERELADSLPCLSFGNALQYEELKRYYQQDGQLGVDPERPEQDCTIPYISPFMQPNLNPEVYQHTNSVSLDVFPFSSWKRCCEIRRHSAPIDMSSVCRSILRT